MKLLNYLIVLLIFGALTAGMTDYYALAALLLVMNLILAVAREMIKKYLDASNQSSKNTKYPKATEYKKNNERSVKK